MDQLELMRFTVAALERLGLRYYVTGSMASMRYGEARLTNDIDIVIELPAPRVRELCAAFPEDDFYVSKEAAAHAALHGGQFNVIRPDAGLKWTSSSRHPALRIPRASTGHPPRDRRRR